MRAAALALAAALLAACGGAAPLVGPAPGAPAVPAPEIPAPPPIPKDANVVLTVSEAVPGPDQDTAAYVKVFVDGKEAGQTAIGPKSQDKQWGAALEPGNHLFRFELWTLPLPGEWSPLSVQWQPPERFIRVMPGARTLIFLKFQDGGRRHTLKLLGDMFK